MVMEGLYFAENDFNKHVIARRDAKGIFKTKIKKFIYVTSTTAGFESGSS